MKKLACIFSMVFAVLSVYGQDVTHNLSRKEADALLKSLSEEHADTARINSFLKLAQFNILKPGSLKADLDSAALFIKQAKNIYAKGGVPDVNGYIVLVEGYLLGEKGDRDAEKKYLDTAISILSNTGDKLHLGQAYFELSGFYSYRKAAQAAEKIRLVEQALACYQSLGNTELLAYTLKFLSDLYNLHGEPLKALETITSSLKYYSAIHYNKLQGVYIVFAQIYYRLGDYRKSFDYAMTALKTAQQMNDTTMQLCEIDNQIGISLGDLSEYGRAIPYFKDALSIAMHNKDYDAAYEMAGNVVQDYLKLNQPEEALNFFKYFNREIKIPKDDFFTLIVNDTYLDIFNQLRKVSSGQPYYDQLVIMDKSPIMSDGIRRNIYPSMIVFNIISKKYAVARDLIQKYQLALEKIKDPIALGLKYKYNFMIDTAMGDFNSAVRNLVRNMEIKDSLYTEGKSKQLQNFLAQYETEKKESEIKILSQKNELQQNSLQKANLIKDITFGSIILLSVILGLLYRQFQIKKRNNIITEQNSALIIQKNKLLQHLLNEKEWLLKEVHHRVKNNLHTVICLLESQAAYLENDALKAIETSQHRIYAMSLIHQKLYQSDDIKTIDMSTYLPEFVNYLNESFDTQKKIRFSLDIQPLALSVSQAIPVALIINEAVTNSIKYAFPDQRNGLIEVSLHQLGEKIKLTIADNGIGIDPEIASKPSVSLGLKLMKGLSEDINGTIQIKNDMGTKIVIISSVDPLNENLPEFDEMQQS